MAVDLEKLLVGWLSPEIPDTRVCTELPATLPELTVQVTQLPGGVRPLVSFEDVRVDIDSYGQSREAARQLADNVDRLITEELPGHVVSGVLIQSADGSSAAWTPYDNTNVRRMTATYVVRTKNLA